MWGVFMLIQDFLLYFILTVLAVVILETSVIMALRLWGEIYEKFFKKNTK